MFFVSVKLLSWIKQLMIIGTKFTWVFLKLFLEELRILNQNNERSCMKLKVSLCTFLIVIVSCVSGPVEYCRDHGAEYPDVQQCYADYRRREDAMWDQINANNQAYAQRQQEFYSQHQQQQPIFTPIKQVDYSCVSDCQRKGYLYQYCQKQCEY